MNKPRLCLVSPPHPYLRDPKAQAPLGLLYVAAAVRKRGFPVEFLDLGDKQIGDKFELPEADVFGITGTVLDRGPCEAVARQARRQYPGARVVLGGPITLSMDRLDGTLFDTAVFGEGENVIMEVLRDYPRPKREYRARRIEDLDALPFPARDLLGGQLGGDVFANRTRYFKGGSTVFVTSRGCPFACTFCASPRLWGRHVVFRDADKIVDEIEHVIAAYGVRQFRFSDDHVTANKVRLKRLCERLEPLDIAWRASIRARPNSPDVFEAMKRGGCAEVCFGVESGDPDVLHALDKRTTPEDNRKAIVNAKAAGLAVRVLFMAGTPGETPKTVDRNIAFLDSVVDHFDTIALTNFVPLPGTRVADDPEKCGCEILDDDIDKFNLVFYGPDGEEREWPNLVRPVGMTIEQLTESKRRMREYVKEIEKVNKG